ncbi:MAG: tRNA glutamyl-Q(34) synthetase GluQRS [Rhodoferax sp.]|uniref:tRNA glutamyl-Q(34) synthetase GluQRS n=1 Tax=Rhodoferax sp. TaxID=50421 RepID=UPI001B69CD19|nr:tRNA glutamyl-Q(34) synthetase GluQRS [Rhodoferax sp.]MBP9904939.1 tRNA glutamyl-Q(34) synthetase GluQRS [Rhodoferax sp.]
MSSGYVGRFAPSPTGPLHAGSLVAALASWLDARAHDGQWLVRMEDVDRTRCQPGLDATILQQLAQCGLHSDRPLLYQSGRDSVYQGALDDLAQRGWAYPCGCSRKDIAAAQPAGETVKSRHAELIYPGTCRPGLQGKAPRAWRFRTNSLDNIWPQAHTSQRFQATNLVTEVSHRWVPDPTVNWNDRRLGQQQQNVSTEVGDFVLKRADGCFAYQLAVVLDDAAQGVTHVVRGEDLADNTARQILLQHALRLATPSYLHTPLVLGVNGEKLSKQNGAQAVRTCSDRDVQQALHDAAAALDLSRPSGSTPDLLQHWVAQWRQKFA